MSTDPSTMAIPSPHKPPAPEVEGDSPVSRGAVWRRVDLHLHSPGVSSFRAPDGADFGSPAGRDAVVEGYVRQLVNSGIELAAITDYNGVREEWFKPIQDRAAARGIQVLPGAEISFQGPKHGLHVLAIFGADEDPSAINSFLQSGDQDPSRPLFSPDRSHRDIRCRDPIEGFLQKLRSRFACLLIFPHPDQANGFCKSFRALDAANLLDSVVPDAIEHSPPEVLERLITTGAVSRERLGRLAQVEFSDPKRIEEIGAKTTADGEPRATFLKLSVLDLEALRLALHDPATRLSLGAPPAATHCRIRSFRVTSSGFLKNLEIDWNDDLNVLIGGRGAGKSAIIETLRYALDLPPIADEDIRNRLVRYALASGGQVEVILERPLGQGQPKVYRVQRVLGQRPEVFDRETGSPISVAPGDLLGPAGGPTVFGQREIYLVSGSEEYRLSLLDELIGEEAHRRAQEVRATLEQLATNGRKIRELRARLAKRDQHQARLRAINHELKVYEEHGAAAKLQEASRLSSDGQHLRNAGSTVREAQQPWERLGPEVLAPLEAAERRLGRGESRQKAILGEAASVARELREGLEQIVQQGRQLFDHAVPRLGEIDERWKNTLKPLREEIDRIKREAQSDQLDPDRLLRLNEERAGLVPVIEDLTRVERELEREAGQRQRLLRLVRERRLAEHQLRRERADRISELLEHRVRLSVDFKGQKEPYRKELEALTKGAGLWEKAVDTLASPTATDGIALAEAVRQGQEAVHKQFDISEAMSAKLVQWFEADEARLHKLETMIPEDSLQIALEVDEEYRPLDQLSVGQRATAILLLLFALEGRVLVLDQPEDDLDNRFVYEDVVQILREQKGLDPQHRRRQIITATHNANIPVIGDAELVLPLEARSGTIRVVHRGSIDDQEIREQVKTIMEGGEEAFRLRSEKYGGLRSDGWT